MSRADAETALDERQHAIIAGIARIFEKALTTETEEELGRACLAIAEEVTASKFGFMAEVNRNAGRLDDIAISDPGWDACRMPEKAGHGQRKVPIEFEIRGIYGRVIRDGKSLVTNDPRSHPDSIGSPSGHPPLRAFLGVPLLHRGETWGMIAVANREGGYGPDELAAAEALAPAIVQAFMRKRAQEALRESEDRARARAAEMEALVEAVPAAVFVARGPDARHMEGNGLAFAALRQARGTNLSKTAPLGESPRNFRALRRGVELRPEELPMHRAARGEEIRGGEFDLCFDDGEVRCFYGNATPLRDADGRSCGALGAFIDVTALRRAEQGLREANEVLRDADRRKDEFLAMLSHELRNPLAPIRNSVYILRHAPPGGEQARRAQDVIERQAEHLTRLVDDLLDVTRIARGKIELSRSRVDLRELLWRAADDFRMTADERGVVFREVLPSGKVWADADATRVAQLVGNLLHNAAKFTRRGDEVTLSLEVVACEAEIRVRDTGVGIDAELLPRVFEPFVQGERTLARTEGGLGLGLALVKGIAELHGGTVRAESAGRGKGAEFVVRFPLRPPAAAQDAPRAGVRRRGAGRRVLIVDDNVDAARSLAEIVEMLGHAAEVAYDGPSAVEKARATLPSIVLCDIGLPGMSGYEVAKALRATAENRIQLFAVTGYAQPEDVRKAVEAGFDGHVAKPVDPAEIERLLA